MYNLGLASVVVWGKFHYKIRMLSLAPIFLVLIKNSVFRLKKNASKLLFIFNMFYCIYICHYNVIQKIYQTKITLFLRKWYFAELIFAYEQKFSRAYIYDKISISLPWMHRTFFVSIFTSALLRNSSLIECFHHVDENIQLLRVFYRCQTAQHWLANLITRKEKETRGFWME